MHIISNIIMKLFKRKESVEDISKRILDLAYKDFPDQRNSDNILAPPMKAETAIDELIRYLLGEDWYVSYPASRQQIYTEAVYDIERIYKRYKK